MRHLDTFQKEKFPFRLDPPLSSWAVWGNVPKCRVPTGGSARIAVSEGAEERVHLMYEI